MIWRLMWPWLRQQWKLLLGALLLSLVTLLAGVGLFTVAGWFLAGAFLAGTTLTFDLFVPSALVRGLSFLRIAARYAERVVGHIATFQLLADIRTAVFARIGMLGPAQLAHYQEGDLVARLIGDIDVLDTLFLLVVAPVLTAVIASALFGLVVGVHVPLLAAVLFAIMLIAACVLPWGVARWAWAPGKQAQKDAAQLRVLIHDAVGGHIDMAAFATSGLAMQRFNQASRCLSHARLRIGAVGAMGQCLQQLMIGVAILAALVIGLQALRRGQLHPALWVGFVLGTIGVFEIIGPLMRGAARMGLATAAASRVGDVLDARTVLHDPAMPLSLPAHGALVMRGVRYSWHEGDPLFRDMDLVIRQGERVAIAGPSGSGKSTLLSLLLRICEPDAGTVSYGGVPLDRATSVQIFQRFKLLSQHSPVFLGTVRTNLLIGKPQASDEDLWRALDDARLGDFVRTLDMGLDTWVGEAGRRLSLGQARRLCLARLLLTDAAVWIMDEPTAGLDVDTQARFLDDLKRVADGRTVVIATHAVLPPGAVDRVLMLSGGSLCASQDPPFRAVRA